MLYRLLFLCCLFSAAASAQNSSYRLNVTVGSQRALTESLNAKPVASVSLERVSLAGVRTNFFVGGGLEYGSFVSGVEDQFPDFILGQVLVDFNFSQTYAPEQLDAFLSVGMEYLVGNFRLRGALHPTLRLHSRITAAERFIFGGPGRPATAASATVRPGERFSWSGNTLQELRYDTPFQLQASLEVDFDLSPGVALGVGVRQDLLDYGLTNQAVDWVEPPNCTPATCSFMPYKIGRTNLQSGTGYVTLRLAL